MTTFDKDKARRATQRGLDIAEDVTRALRKYRAPSAADEQRRKAMHECQPCHYLAGRRIGGAAMTRYVCSVCAVEKLHSSTAVPLLCRECSDEHGLCVRCHGFLEVAR